MGAAVPQIAYTASKGGVLAMTREIAVEFARQNIRANSLCPGPVETPLLAELLADPARRNRRLVHIPPGRFARAEEMANAALFLAGDESSFVNGTSFMVDGGITAAYITPECAARRADGGVRPPRGYATSRPLRHLSRRSRCGRWWCAA
jgi:NAD(P)-dependent dehydrogenase (short-subunit alcohol dehydrogenase family)